MKVQLDSLHLNVHKSFIQRSYNHIKSSQSLTLGAKGWVPFVSSSKIKWFIKKIIFWLTVFIAINIIQVIVFYGKESTDFIHYLCQTKFNNWSGLFLYWVAVIEDNSYEVFKKRKRNQIPF